MDEDERERSADHEEQDLGSRRTMRKHDLRGPGEQERVEHEMTHLSFCCWCRHWIKGRGREGHCPRAAEEERHVTQRRLEHMFTGDEKDGKC